jgi:hypothetical protein
VREREDSGAAVKDTTFILYWGEAKYFYTFNVPRQWPFVLLIEISLREGNALESTALGSGLCCEQKKVAEQGPPASHRGCPGSSPGQIMWDFLWTKWHWGMFSLSIPVSPVNLHSTNYSTITLIYHLGLVQ